MRGRWVVGGLGIVGIAVGIAQLVLGANQAPPAGVVAWLLGVLVLDDVILVPAALGIGWVVGHLVPRRGRAPVQAALVVVLGMALVGGVFALSPARGSQSGTLLTEPYGRNLALVAAAAAVAVATVLMLDRVRSTHRSGPTRRRGG